jgi:hypothetical protein
MFKIEHSLITGYNYFPGQLSQTSTQQDEERDATEAPIIIYPNEPAGPSYEQKDI